MEEIKDLIKQEDYEKYKKLLQEFECKSIDIIEDLTYQFKETLAEDIDRKIKGWKDEYERLLKENWKKDDRIAELEKQLDQANERLKGAIVLPVKVGDTIYVVPSRTNYQINIINNKEEKNKVSEFVVSEIRYNKYGYSIVCYIDYIPFYFNYETAKGYCEHFNTEKFYGETWFSTLEEAEKKLQELRGGE